MDSMDVSIVLYFAPYEMFMSSGQIKQCPHANAAKANLCLIWKDFDILLFC